MSSLTYRSIKLEFMDTVDMVEEPQNDGDSLVFYRTTIQGVFYYNPQAISYDEGDPTAGTKPKTKKGKSGPQTAKALEWELMQPRGILVYEIGGKTIIQSPAEFDVVDCSNGPYPLYARVLEVLGDKTMKVQFSIRTDINRFPPQNSLGHNVTAASVILSNRWSMTEGITGKKGQLRPSRLITGTVRFNMAKIIGSGFLLDDYRKWLVLKPPRRWERVKCEFTATEEPGLYTYFVLDQQRRTQIVVDGITDVEFQQHITSRQPAFGDWAVGAGLTLLSASVATAKGNYTALLSAFPTIAGSALPLRFFQFRIKLYSNLNVTMEHVKQVAYRALRNRIMRINAGLGIGPTLGFETAGKYTIEDEEIQDSVEGTIEIRYSYITTVGGQLANFFAGALGATGGIPPQRRHPRPG